MIKNEKAFSLFYGILKREASIDSFYKICDIKKVVTQPHIDSTCIDRRFDMSLTPEQLFFFRFLLVFFGITLVVATGIFFTKKVWFPSRRQWEKSYRKVIRKIDEYRTRHEERVSLQEEILLVFLCGRRRHLENIGKKERWLKKGFIT